MKTDLSQGNLASVLEGNRATRSKRKEEGREVGGLKKGIPVKEKSWDQLSSFDRVNLWQEILAEVWRGGEGALAGSIGFEAFEFRIYGQAKISRKICSELGNLREMDV